MGGTPLGSGAVAATYNAAHTRLAVADASGRLAVWQREGGAKSWALASSLAAEGLRITTLAWAPTQFGGLIAGGAADGSVAVWVEGAGGEAAWHLAAVLKESSLAVQDVAFAPPELGPLLAAAYADGFVRYNDIRWVDRCFVTSAAWPRSTDAGPLKLRRPLSNPTPSAQAV